MSIVIKEIILSDSVNQFMEKVNFNFDQLMLAGGGPPGPIGPFGPIGPAGPEGDPGNKWYVGCTGTTTSIGVTLPFGGDLFLYKGGAGQGCNPGSTYPLGQVYDWNTIANEFQDTGLNLLGPTGPTGATGENIGWTIFRGATTGTRWQPQTLANQTGSDSDYVFLTGDTTSPTTSDGFSKDTLYLGGHLTGIASAAAWPLDRQPKLIVNPRTNSEIQAGTYWNQNASIGGKGGGGIVLGWESTVSGTPPAAQSSFSNMFVDSLRNLHISNFTDWISANIAGTGVPTSGINIESVYNVKLFGAGYTHTNSIGIIEAGQNLDFITGGQTAANDRSGILLSTSPIEFGRVRIEQGAGGQFTVGGGGGGNYHGTLGLLPEVSFFNNKGTQIDDMYRIVITPGSTFGAGPSTQAAGGITGQDVPFIGVGNVSNGGTQYIGFGSKLSGTSQFTDMNVTDKKVMIGDVGQVANDWDPTFTALPAYSLDAVGRLRMRTGTMVGSTGSVMVSMDNQGTGDWVDPNSIGSWRVDPLCNNETRISLVTARNFATIAHSETGSLSAKNYSRMDITSYNGHNQAPGASADLFFGSYAGGGPVSTDNSFSIRNDYRDANTQGELSFMTHQNLNPCPTSAELINVDAQSATSQRIGGITEYGQLQLVNNNFSTSIPSSWKYNNRILIEPLTTWQTGGTTISPDIMLLGSSAAAIVANVGPRIKIVQEDDVATGNPNSGNINTTNLTVVRGYDGVIQKGTMDIRFQGVGKADTTAGVAVSGFSGIPDAEGGAAVKMIPDTIGLKSVDSQTQTEVAGRTNDYYEITSKEFFLDSARLNYFSTDTTGRELASRNLTYTQWGASNDQWSSSNGFCGINEFQFNGSNSAVLPATRLPARSKVNLTTANSSGDGAPYRNQQNPNVTNGSSTGYWSNWISPSSSIRLTPENPDRPWMPFGAPSDSSQNGRMHVDFNIDIGWWLSNNQDQSRSGNGVDYRTVYAAYSGVGTVGNQDNVPSIGTGGNNDSYKFMKAVKLQSFRITLKTDQYSGLSETLAFNKPTRRGNMTYGTTGTGASAYAYTTDWYPGVSKPMQGLVATESQQKGGNRNMFTQSSSANSNVYYQNFHPWSTYGTNQEIPLTMIDAENVSMTTAQQLGMRPFLDSASNPTANWSTSLDALIPSVAFSGGLNSFGVYQQYNHDSAGHYQVGNWMWRVCAGYADNEANTFENRSYIEFIYMPPNPWAYTSGQANVTVTGFDGNGGLSGSGYAYTSSMGMPIKFVSQANVKKLNSSAYYWKNAGLAALPRNNTFYKSTGISFSGQAYVSLQHRKNDGAPIVVDDNSKVGGCFIIGTHVLMADNSWKSIETIKIGDLIKTKDGTNVPVLDSFIYNVNDEITMYTKDNLTVTDSHPLYVDGKWQTADELNWENELMYVDNLYYLQTEDNYIVEGIVATGVLDNTHKGTSISKLVLTD